MQKKKNSTQLWVRIAVCKERFRFCKDRLPLKYRRPPSPSNGSLHGDTLAHRHAFPRPFCQNRLLLLVNVAVILCKTLILLVILFNKRYGACLMWSLGEGKCQSVTKPHIFVAFATYDICMLSHPCTFSLILICEI